MFDYKEWSPHHHGRSHFAKWSTGPQQGAICGASPRHSRHQGRRERNRASIKPARSSNGFSLSHVVAESMAQTQRGLGL